jgi:predicted MFS family arabinose efflux permease
VSAAQRLDRAAVATRLAFLAAGFVMACWAPLVPFAKERVGASDAQLGVLLLCLGLGSVVAMPVTGYVSMRRGTRGMILLGGAGLVLVLPLLLLAGALLPLGAALFLFGAALGTIDVAMNVHGAEVERESSRPMMSGFHAMWSVGGIAGAGSMTALLWLGLAPLACALLGALAALVALGVAAPRLLRSRGAVGGPAFALPRGIVLLLATLAAVVFLMEGAILDWGALLIVERGLLDATQGGLGYMLFATAMALGRIWGDRAVLRLGAFRTLVWGGAVTILGIALMLVSGPVVPAMAGFFLVGLGAANLVPVLFSAAGRQNVMPPALAVAAITTTGYAGILLGPAMIGFVAEAAGLVVAFWGLAALMLAFPLTAATVARR